MADWRVGLGQIGQQVAVLAQAFGARVTAGSPNLPPDDPWRAAATRFGDRLLLTPHLGYVSAATWRLFYTETVEAVAAWIAGHPVRVLNG